MNNRTAEILTALCQGQRALLHKDGSVNHNEAARRIGMNQPTFTRIISGASKNPSEESISAIAGYFGVSKAYVRGETASDDYPKRIESHNSGPGVADDTALTPRAEAVLQKIMNLPPDRAALAVKLLEVLADE